MTGTKDILISWNDLGLSRWKLLIALEIIDSCLEFLYLSTWTISAFLRFANFYQQFIKNFYKIAALLNFRLKIRNQKLTKRSLVISLIVVSMKLMTEIHRICPNQKSQMKLIFSKRMFSLLKAKLAFTQLKDSIQDLELRTIGHHLTLVLTDHNKLC